jgi:negative regulator of flagellin synthesis FlgM
MPTHDTTGIQESVMKLTEVISHIRMDNKIEVRKARESGKLAETIPLASSDSVQISAGSKEVLKMQDIVKNTPSVRTEMVEDLKRQVENGEYQVSGTQIADKMMESWLTDEGILGS